MRNNLAKLNEEQKDRLIADLKAGHTIREVMEKYDLAKSSVSYYRTKYAPDSGQFPRSTARYFKYDWRSIQSWYDQGNSIRVCQRKFGFTTATWVKAKKRGDFVTRPHSHVEIPNRIMFTRNPNVTRHMVKKRVLRDELIPYQCAIDICPIVDEWNGKKIVLHLDHINGDKHDHRLKNMRFLCPNCHTQTDTYTGRNSFNYKQLEELSSAVD